VRFLTVAASRFCCGGTAPITQTTGQTDQPRPDVQNAFPAAGPDAGFQVRLPYGGGSLYPVLVCAYAHQEQPGSNTERFIGCSDTSNTTHD
jgi:hypothetical protein